MSPLTASSVRIDSRAKLMAVLFVAQVCGSTGHSIGLAVGGIMAASITGTNTWTGLPVALGALGTALASWPLARLMDRAGRRPGLALGYGLAVVGALLGLVGAAVRSFPLMLAGMTLFGIASTSNLLARYAAADVSPARSAAAPWGSSSGARRSAPSWGPNLMAPALRAGPLARGRGRPPAPSWSASADTRSRRSSSRLFLRPDPLAIARRLEADASRGRAAGARARSARILGDVRVQIAFAALSVSQFVMIGTTSTSPVYLHDQGHSVQTSASASPCTWAGCTWPRRCRGGSAIASAACS